MHKMVVFAKAAPGKVEELARWYDDEHLNELLETPGFVSVERHKLVPVKRPDGLPQWDFMLIYELAGDDPMPVLGGMRADRFRWSDALESASTLSVLGLSVVRREKDVS
jgi:hypothetical protein